MVLNRETDKLFKKLEELCGDILTKECLVGYFQKANNEYEFKYLVFQDYIDELNFLKKL